MTAPRKARVIALDEHYWDREVAASWIPTIPLSAEDKTKILSGNAERLLRL